MRPPIPSQRTPEPAMSGASEAAWPAGPRPIQISALGSGPAPPPVGTGPPSPPIRRAPRLAAAVWRGRKPLRDKWRRAQPGPELSSGKEPLVLLVSVHCCDERPIAVPDLCGHHLARSKQSFARLTPARMRHGGVHVGPETVLAFL